MAKQESRRIFREQALEQLSSPEQLDQLLKVVSRRSWIPILSLAGGLILAVVWSVFGRIPQTVDGVGILVHPNQVRPFQSPASGQIVELNVQVGGPVQKGGLLGRINQPELRHRLDQERIHLEEQKKRDKKLLELMEDRITLEKDSIQKNRELLEERIQSITDMAEEEKDENATYFATLDKNLGYLDDLTQKITRDVKEQYDHFSRLKEQGSATEAEVQTARRKYFEADMQRADLVVRRREFELKKLEAQAEYRRRMERIADLGFQLQQLNVQESKIDQLQLEAESKSELAVDEIKRNIERYKKELETKGRIISEYTGKILELSAAVGQIVSAGERLGAMEVEQEEGELVAIVYFELSDGKKIKQGMQTQVAPRTVQRERYGSIIGSVLEVSEYAYSTAAATNVVGSAEVARRLTEGGNKIQVKSTLVLDPETHTGYKWTSRKGPGDVSISVGTPVTVRTIIGNRRPISYVIPLMRRWSGS